ncbi:MAG: DEAD/DEAH box helicase, partial [bacterium]|nr:DEAD/DEAH box helicase [bacterium]
MFKSPPEILITTPESLNLLLSSASGRNVLMNLKTVILDEIHSIMGSKRGVHLITAVDRLILLSGEFQRIALSATIKPLKTVAEFIGGYRLDKKKYTPRKVEIVRSIVEKKYDVKVCYPEEAASQPPEESIWHPLVKKFKEKIDHNRSTLLFVNSRRLCETLTLKINRGESKPLAYAHHGSLSKEIRKTVEEQLKAGELKAILATNSLEMGIDIGSLDEVLMVQAPPTISSAIQRIGRAGHQIGVISKGGIYPTHNQDFLEAAILAKAIVEGDIEEVRPIRNPLDLLSQIVISMVGTEVWDIDQLYAQIKTSTPYHELSRKEFDLVTDMLAGRYTNSRIRDLKPRVSIDKLDNTIQARKGALLVLYMSGGTIPDRGYYQLRYQESSAKIGELDEEFVWEATPGQTFNLGSQNWKIERITHNDVFVIPASPKAMATPFWKGESRDRDYHFSMKIADFLEEADQELNEDSFLEKLITQYSMETLAAKQLLIFLKKQKEITKSDLPHRHHLLVEITATGPGMAPGNQVVLNTCWGGSLNRPFAMALDAAWEKRFGSKLEIFSANDCIAFLLPHEVSADEILSLVNEGNVEELLRERLEGSGYFGARFRECAGRSLLLPKNKLNQRMPLWMSRLRSQKLMESVLKYEDFPILLEAWRSCLQDDFDIRNLKLMLNELSTGVIRWSVTRTERPGPMAQSITTGQISEYMYKTDQLEGARSSSLNRDLLRDVVFTPGLRPTLSKQSVENFECKRQRRFPGYSPSSPLELLDWVKERLLLPESEWSDIL